jgi:8-oxo-dGTP pyrophosphatase MutT (NUDIX family)
MPTKKPEIKREYSAGGVVFKKEGKKVSWLICQPKITKSEPWRKGRWQFPKGWIDPGETSQQAALRETEEEGGVKAEIIEKIGTITIFFYNEEKQKIVKKVVFYLMRWIKNIKEGPGWETEKALWMPYEKAKEKLTFKSEKETLEKAQKILEAGEKQQSLI